jgi:hypothetical protein
MRWRLAAGLGLGLALGHACSDQGFECESDEQCSLAGQPGSCVAGGHCAYPEPDCPSGLAYPQGAPDGLAGECVPGEATGSGSEGQTGDTGDTATTSTSDGEPPPDLGSSDDGSSSSSGDPLACGDAYEPNDDPASASAISLTPRDCQANWDAFLDDPRDADWFLLTTTNMTCSLSAELTFVTTPALQLCVVPQCSDGVAGSVVACDGEIVPLATGPACCGVEQVRVTADCENEPPIMQLGVAASDTPACLPYQAAAFL